MRPPITQSAYQFQSPQKRNAKIMESSVFATLYTVVAWYVAAVCMPIQNAFLFIFRRFAAVLLSVGNVQRHVLQQWRHHHYVSELRANADWSLSDGAVRHWLHGGRHGWRG